MKYNVGDRVIFEQGAATIIRTPDSRDIIGECKCNCDNGPSSYIIKREDGGGWSCHLHGKNLWFVSIEELLPLKLSPLVLFKGAKIPMTTKLNNMMKRLLDKDTQTLIRAGFINGDLELSDEGMRTLVVILFEQNKTALISLAQEKIDECKEEKWN